ncbi:hypothetical protein Tco_1150004, partial [Tanacetum coccineum]
LHINPSNKAGQVNFIFDNILNQTPVAITPAFDKPLAIMANLAKESSRSSTTTVEKMRDISTQSDVPELHLPDKVAYQESQTLGHPKNAL